MTEQVDYAQVLADLERRRDEMNQAIATIRVLAGLAPEGTDVSVSQQRAAANGAAAGLRPHMFFGMKAPDAVRAYLDAVKQTRTAAKIAADLIEYGWNTTSDNPANIIRTALVRLAEAGEVVKVKGKEWGLVSWFPGLNRGKRTTSDSGKSEAIAREEGPKKSQKPRSPYHAFLAAKMKEGMSMKQAAEAWAKEKQVGG